MSRREIEISRVRIADDSRCFVIAEIGHNHQGNVDTAKKMIKAAVDAGASAVKLQKRDNRSLFTSAYYDRPYNSENSFGNTYGTDSASLLLIDALEQAKETHTACLVSSCDIRRAIDSIRKPALQMAWTRLGVPKE